MSEKYSKARVTSTKSGRRVWILGLAGLNILTLVAVLLFIVWDRSYSNQLSSEPSSSAVSLLSSSESSSSASDAALAVSSFSASIALAERDLAGEAITAGLQEIGINMGFISSNNLLELNQKLPIKINGERTILVDPAILQKPSLLKDLVPIPAQSDKKSWLSFDTYQIQAPIQYSTFEDLFQVQPDTTVNFAKPVDNGPINSPIQEKLKNGVVHLAFSPLPGEIGNSYIVGHSSNYASVKSDYNEVFKFLEKQSKVGDEFYIYDHQGRRLKFQVFEARAVTQDSSGEAYQNFPGRRVVTLQASILERVGGKLVPTKRWLTRGELMLRE